MRNFIAQMRRLLDVAEHFEARGEHVDVGFVFEKGRVDGGVVGCEGGFDVDCASAERVLEAHGGGDGLGVVDGVGGGREDAGLVFDALFHAVVVGDEDELEVGRGVVLEVGDGAFVLFALVRGEVGEFGLDVFDDGGEFFGRGKLLVGEEALHGADAGEGTAARLGELLLCGFHHGRVVNGFERHVARLDFPAAYSEDVVLEVGADSSVLNQRLYAGRTEDVRVTNTRQLENLW